MFYITNRTRRAFLATCGMLLSGVLGGLVCPHGCPQMSSRIARLRRPWAGPQSGLIAAPQRWFGSVPTDLAASMPQLPTVGGVQRDLVDVLIASCPVEHTRTAPRRPSAAAKGVHRIDYAMRQRSPLWAAPGKSSASPALVERSSGHTCSVKPLIPRCPHASTPYHGTSTFDLTPIPIHRQLPAHDVRVIGTAAGKDYQDPVVIGTCHTGSGGSWHHLVPAGPRPRRSRPGQVGSGVILIRHGHEYLRRACLL